MEIEHVKEKILEGRPGFPREYGPQRRDHQPGIPLFPQEATRDLVVIFLLTGIMFFLSAFVTPLLGPARSPQLSELIVPDWYLLFSWGLLKVADILPQFVVGAGTPLKADFNAVFWGDLLTGIPIIALLLLPFLDRGREARPAKAPIRSAVGVAGIASIFTSSLYAIREVVARRFKRLDDQGEVFPDILLIDGGKGQLGAALAAFSALAIEPPMVISLAKREEEVFVMHVDEPLRLSRHSYALRLLQYVRDEAHRFAQHYHHILRRRSTLGE